MRKRVHIQFLLFSCLFLVLGMTGTAYADSASVLPEGISAVGIDGQFYMPVKERYNQDGKAEKIANDYNTDLNKDIFADLAAVEAGFGGMFVPGSLGASVVSFKYNIQTYNFTYLRGITDKLTVGIRIPYWSVKNNVSTSLDTTNATVGKSATGAFLGVAPFVPLAGTAPGADPWGDAELLTTEDILDLLSEGLDIDGDGIPDILGFGFKKFGTWSGSGMGDIAVSAKYQYFNSDSWKLAFNGGISFPTGEVDDPDSLVDLPPGSGTYTLLFKFNNDYTAIENWVFNATFRYDLALPDKETMRVPSDPSLPITTVKENVKRDLGDLLVFDGSATYKIRKNMGVSGRYKYVTKRKDKVSGDLGIDYGGLEAETDITEQVYIIGLTYDTITLYKAKEFPVPLMASLSYRDRFAGSNNVLKSQYIGLSLMAFF